MYIVQLKPHDHPYITTITIIFNGETGYKKLNFTFCVNKTERQAVVSVKRKDTILATQKENKIKERKFCVCTLLQTKQYKTMLYKLRMR